MLPETTYDENVPQMSDDTEKNENHIKSVGTTTSFDERATAMDYREYWKGLFTLGIMKGARQRGPLKHFIYTFCLPFPLLLIPGVLLASIMYGVVLGG